jgi:hypothetical protein
MINKFSLAKSLYDQAKLISNSNSLNLVADGEEYTTTPNEEYIEDHVLFGKDDSVGISDASSDIQLGVYQLTINTPKAEEGAKWRGLQIANIYQEGFPKGLELTHDNQAARIRNTSIVPLGQNDTHLVFVLSVQYSVIN